MWSSKHTVNTLDKQLSCTHGFVAGCLGGHFWAFGVCFWHPVVFEGGRDQRMKKYNSTY